MKKVKKYFLMLIQIVKVGIKSGPISFFIMVVGSLGMAIAFVLQAETEKRLFDGAIIFASNGKIQNLIFSLLLFIFSYLFTQIIIYITNCSEEILEFTMQKQLSKKICDKTSKINAQYFEDSIFLDMLTKSMKGKEGAVSIVICVIALVFYYIPYFIFMSVWLFNVNKILVFAVPIAFIPSVISYVFQIKVFSKNEEETAPLRRRLQAYEENMIGKKQIKETRILGCASYFLELFQDVLNSITQKDLAVRNKRQKLNIILKGIQAIGFILILLGALYLVTKGHISVGAFAAIFSSIDILFSNMNEAVSRQFGAISEQFGTVNNYFTFMNNHELSGEDHDKKLVTEFDNVTFKYPNSEKASLNGVSLKIFPGERIAIVGENGAGKSTLVKVLLGIYKPTSGNIVKQVDLEKGKSAVFQNYINYSMTLKENVTVSNSGENEDYEKVMQAINGAGISCEDEKFPNKLDTLLGKEFGGIELSGGEWQRVAIARGIYKNSDLIVFDEPSSAIDPLEETKIYEKIECLSKDKTAFIVTHRMATVRFVDRILVIQNGKIVEDGNHQTLMDINGEYSRLYLTQSEMYRNAVVSKI